MQRQCNGIFEPSPQNMNATQWYLFKQPPIGKTRDKYVFYSLYIEMK